MYETESSRWQAISSRDHAASSAFVYAVISTKIYCRPGCPSRLARRANVCFYDTASQAARAGYRACLRCKPERSMIGADSHSAQRDAVKRACEHIEQMNGQAKFVDVANHVGLSTRYLYGIFRAVTGTTPAKHADRFKPAASTHQVPATPPDVSGTISSWDDPAVEPIVDLPAWNALLDFGRADLTVLQENDVLSLQHDPVSNCFAPLPDLDFKDFDVYDCSELTSFELNDPFLADVSFQDLSLNTTLR